MPPGFDKSLHTYVTLWPNVNTLIVTRRRLSQICRKRHLLYISTRVPSSTLVSNSPLCHQTTDVWFNTDTTRVACPTCPILTAQDWLWTTSWHMQMGLAEIHSPPRLMFDTSNIQAPPNVVTSTPFWLRDGRLVEVQHPATNTRQLARIISRRDTAYAVSFVCITDASISTIPALPRPGSVTADWSGFQWL